MRIVEKSEKNGGSIKTQFLYSFLSVGILPIVIFGIVSGMIIKSSMYSSEISSLSQISSMVTENLDNWGEKNILLVEDIASSQIVLANKTEMIQTELRNKQAQDTGIMNIMYVDVYGNVLADSLGSRNVNLSSEEYFKKVSNGYSYVSDVIVNEGNNIPFIIFSAPVKVDNVVTGYIINKVKTDTIGNSIGKITYSENGQVYTFNSDGYITYHSDTSKIMNENLIKSSSKLSVAATKALEGNFNSINYSYDGEKGVAVYNFIPSLKWGTMTTIPNADMYKAFRRVFLTCTPVVIIILLLIIAFASYITKNFVSVFAQIVSFTQEVAEGNLTINCSLEGATEVTNIGHNLNEMVKSLKELVLSITDKSNFLNNASLELNELSTNAEENSRDISKAMDEIAEGSVAQAERTDDVLSHVRDLDKKMNELTDKVDETNRALKISDNALLKGNRGTKDLQESTGKQFELVGQAVDEVNELGKFVKNIDSIVHTISDIAEQTSLLALNASIEAARVGESGKGFAVVAEEVAKLASESQKATSETAAILGSIKNKADITTNIMNSIDEGMKLQLSKVKETMNIFSEITDADERISENIKSFTTLIEYVKGFSDELLQLIETLASSAEESAAVAEEVTASSEDQIGVVEKVKLSGDNILQIVDELKLNIEKFKIE